MPFIRIGCSGDPSENWQHRINIIEKIRTPKQLSLFDLKSGKQIVIITRHWNELTDLQMGELSKFNICFNTSVSALDPPELIERSLLNYNRLAKYCKSCLRVVTCDFNLQNETGRKLSEIQNELLKNKLVIDTVFRPSSKNYFLVNGIIKAKKMGFMKSTALVSKFNKKAYLGKCSTCLEMCGLNV